MISKKILALVLALSVIVCALPAFSVSAAESSWPNEAETIENPKVVFKNSLEVNFDKISDTLKEALSSGLPSSNALKISGSVTFGELTINFSDYIIRNGNATKISGWGSDFVAGNPEVVEILKASTAEGLERDDDGNVITASGQGIGEATIRNFVRHIMTMKGEDYSEIEDIRNHAVEADSAVIRVEPIPNAWFNDYPAGSYFLPISTSYVKHGVSSDYKISNGTMYVPGVYGVGSAPYGIFTVNCTGEYEVWLLKRDRNHTDVPNSNRDIYLDVAGKTLEFAGIDGIGDDLNKRYFVPEDNGTTVTLEAGKKFTIGINNKTGVYATGQGILLVPKAAATDEVKKAITGKVAVKEEAVAAYELSKLTGMAKDYAIPATKTVNVTICGTPITVTSNDAQEYYSTLPISDAKGYYIEDVTYLDAIVAADKAKVELPFKISRGFESDTTVTPIVYDTTILSDNTWPTSSGNTYGFLWGASEVFYSNSSAGYTTTVNAPKAGNYYAFANGMGWNKGRNLTITVNGKAVEVDTGDTTFFDETENNMTTVVAKIPVALNKGANTIKMAPNGQVVRCAFVAFVEAESYDAACALVEQITVSKEAFTNYYDISGAVYKNGRFLNYAGVSLVNGTAINGDLDQVSISEGDVLNFASIDKTNFAPVNLTKIYAYGGSDAGDSLVAAGFKTTDYSEKFCAYSSDANIFPVDVSAVDALAGCYLNGYVIIKEDCTGQKISGGLCPNTTGDDTGIKVFINDLPIIHSVKGNRIELAAKGNPNNIFSTEYTFADLDGDGVDESYASASTLSKGAWGLYDDSNLYLTNSTSAAPVKVTATKKSEGVYNLTINKSAPVAVVKVTKNDNVVTSQAIENYVLDFMDADGVDITVAEGQTAYIWLGTNVGQGTLIKPLCAPIVR